MTPPRFPPPQLITTPETLALLIDDLHHAGRYALDTESNSLYAYYHRVCLVQISTAESDYIIDTVILTDLSALQAVATADMEVVIHAAENDLLLLDRDFGLRFGRVFDTLWAARVLGWPRVGLASILEDQFGVRVDKRMQRTDWGRRPLNSAQLEYARLDTHFLLALRDQQEAELRERKRWREAQEVFAGLSEIVWEEKEPSTFWRLSGVYDLEPQQQAVLESLFEWREANAQRRDVPPFKIMRNEALMEMAVSQPSTVEQVRQIRDVSNRLPDRSARAILKAIQNGQHRQPPAPPERNHYPRPDDDTLACYERLRSWRSRTASARGVDPDVVLTNYVLMAIARLDPPNLDSLAQSDALSPWKLDAYGSEIVAVCTKK